MEHPSLVSFQRKQTDKVHLDLYMFPKYSLLLVLHLGDCYVIMMNRRTIMGSADKVLDKIPTDKAYDDLIHPTAASTGKVVSLIPRTVHAILAPLEKWIITREYSIKETEKLLELKLEHVSSDEIEPPETHIAVPALQYIAYSMDNEEIRNLYANLLSASMQKSLKGEVHPSFVEVIKQITPDEARILKYLYRIKSIPIFKVNRHDLPEGSGYITTALHISLLPQKIQLERGDLVPTLLENLQRLSLLELTYAESYTNDENYSELKSYFKSALQTLNDRDGDKYNYKQINGLCIITNYGKAFCKICID